MPAALRACTDGRQILVDNPVRKTATVVELIVSPQSVEFLPRLRTIRNPRREVLDAYKSNPILLSFHSLVLITLHIPSADPMDLLLTD